MIWARMPSGALNPLDAEPVVNGNIRIDEGEDGQIHGNVMSALEAAAYEGPKYQSHYASCPDANSHRKPRRA
jgi:hypothetical protein